MEEKDLQELERALQAATPPPWTTDGSEVFAARRPVVHHGYDVPSGFLQSEDADLTVAIVNAAPSLISDLREARRLLGEARMDGRREAWRDAAEYWGVKRNWQLQTTWGTVALHFRDLAQGHMPGCPAIADDESDAVLDDYQHCVCEEGEKRRATSGLPAAGAPESNAVGSKVAHDPREEER